MPCLCISCQPQQLSIYSWTSQVGNTKQIHTNLTGAMLPIMVVQVGCNKSLVMSTPIPVIQQDRRVNFTFYIKVQDMVVQHWIEGRMLYIPMEPFCHTWSSSGWSRIFMIMSDLHSPTTFGVLLMANWEHPELSGQLNWCSSQGS